jgi:hypothetical protein
MKAWPGRLAAAGFGLLAVALMPCPASAQKAREAWEYLKEPAFKSAYVKALGPRANTPWLARRDGPAPPDRFVEVGGQRYVLNAFCKAHDCSDHNAVVLYSPAKKVVYGSIHEKGKTTLIGDPPEAVARELPVLWKKEWRGP